MRASPISAAAAGVSPTTVSRVLNNKRGDIRISDKTRALVLDVAKQLGYQRNPLASALRSNRTGIIGAINSAMSGTYMSRLAHHIQLVAQERNIDLFVGAPRESSDAIAGQLSVLQSHLFDGVLFLGDLARYQAFASRDFAQPHVHVLPGDEQWLPLVSVDEAQGVKLALDHLTDLGHRRIGLPRQPSLALGRAAHTVLSALHRPPPGAGFSAASRFGSHPLSGKISPATPM